ncbi:hypothetical protein [Streptomyces sp. NPDC087294]|uniref:hypothetical protein n=1 Tax=Streptomyces sp. NPDC087294 TaxID=3365777 RepID=UPI0038275709
MTRAPEPSGYLAETGAEWLIPGTRENARCLLATFRSISPKLALRWLSGEALRIADRLDPQPTGTPWVSPLMHAFRLVKPGCPTELRAWATDHAELRAARAHIKNGHPLFARFPDTDCTYTLTIRPVTFPTNWPAQHGRSAPTPVRYRIGGLAHPLYVLAAEDSWTQP